MATKIKGLDMLEKHGLSVVRKYNICDGSSITF